MLLYSWLLSTLKLPTLFLQSNLPTRTVKQVSTESGGSVKQEYKRGYNSELFHISCCDSNGSNYMKGNKSLLRRMRKVTKSAHYIRYVCPSVLLSYEYITAAPTGRISVKFDIRDFYKNLSINSKFG
jgi:hypothetical protein